MTTYQSTSLHVEDADEKSLAFTVADNPGEDDYALKAWSTFILPDNQVVNVEVKFAPDDVRDLQAFLRDRFGAGVRSQNLADHRTPEEQAHWAATQKPSDDTVASFFQDGWMASLRELLEMSKVRGYEEAIAWAKNQLGTYVGPAALQPVAYEPTTGGELLGEEAPQPGDTVTHAEYDPSLPVICNRTDPHHHMIDSTGVHWVHDGAEEACPLPDNHHPILVTCAGSGNHTPQNLSDNPHSVQHPSNQAPVNTEPSEAEKGRRRRLKVEMEFDDALDKHKAAPSDETWAALSAAYNAVAKREPGNSRVRRTLADLAGTPAELITTEAQTLQIPTGPVPAFAPEPLVGTPVAVGASYLAQSQHPINQQFQDAADALPGVHVQDSVVMTPEQAAAAAFPCPQHAADGRACMRPFGHELATATNPEPKPHVYPTSQQMLETQGQQYGVQTIQQHPSQGFIAPPAAGPVAVGPLSFQVPPTPEQAAPHPDLVQQPAAPAAPFWQAPQT